MGTFPSEKLKNAKWQTDGYICQISREKLRDVESEMVRMEMILKGMKKTHPAFYISRNRARLSVMKQEQKVYARNVTRYCNTEAMRDHPATATIPQDVSPGESQ